MSQLRSDLEKAFQAACGKVESYPDGGGDLLESVRRLINGPMRFVEPNGDIQEAQSLMIEHIDDLQELLAEPDQEEGGRLRQARRAACEAVEAVHQATLEHGYASAAADRVGLGVLGKRI